MADFWIKIEKSTPDKPEIFEMAQILNIDPDAVLGKLIRVWCWVDSNSSDGHVNSVTNVLIDRLTSCAGFSDAMKACGWLTENNVPNFDRHLGKSAKKRAMDSERKRKTRKTGQESEQCHAQNTTKTGLDKIREDRDKILEREGESKELFTHSAVFTLNQDWVPDDEIWRGLSFRAGMTKPYQPYLVEFICHYQSHKPNTEAYWIGKLIAWIKRDNTPINQQSEQKALIDATSGASRSRWADIKPSNDFDGVQ